MYIFKAERWPLPPFSRCFRISISPQNPVPLLPLAARFASCGLPSYPSLLPPFSRLPLWPSSAHPRWSPGRVIRSECFFLARSIQIARVSLRPIASLLSSLVFLAFRPLRKPSRPTARSSLHPPLSTNSFPVRNYVD